MDFHPDDGQALLQATARDLLRSPAWIGADAADRWRTMAELGWLGWVLPIEAGGGGGRFLDLVLLEEEIGRVGGITAFHAGVVRAGLTAHALATPEQGAAVLGPIAHGERRLRLAIAEPDDDIDGARIAVRAERVAAGWRLDGVKVFVPDADDADAFLVIARTSGDATDREGVTAFLVERDVDGLSATPTPALGDAGQACLRFEGVVVADDSIVGGVGAAWPAVDTAARQATVGLAAEMLGGAGAVLELTVAHLRERRQRGRALGSHQSLQHRAADVAVAVDAGRVLVYDAAWRLDQGQPAEIAVAMAKAWMNDAYRDATWAAALIHGGTGFMADHPLAVHYPRARAAESWLGGTEHHRSAIAAGLLEPSPAAAERIA